MANIHIARNHGSLGSFSESEIRDGVRTGRFLPGDLSWREGMAEWKPLGEMAQAWGIEIPSPGEAEATPPPPELPVERTGPQWEHRATVGVPAALFQTVQDVLFRPSSTFASLRRDGGLAAPLLYFVVLSSVMFAVSVFYEYAAVSNNPAFLSQFPQVGKSAVMVALGGSVLMAPAFYVAAAFFNAGVTHLVLKLLGGAHHPFETTFRVVCYAEASASVFKAFPLFGGLISMLWGAWVIIVGLREAQGIPGWKATLAVVLPGLVFFSLFLGILGYWMSKVGMAVFGGLP